MTVMTFLSATPSATSRSAQLLLTSCALANFGFLLSLAGSTTTLARAPMRLILACAQTQQGDRPALRVLIFGSLSLLGLGIVASQSVLYAQFIAA